MKRRLNVDGYLNRGDHLPDNRGSAPRSGTDFGQINGCYTVKVLLKSDRGWNTIRFQPNFRVRAELRAAGRMPVSNLHQMWIESIERKAA